MIAAAASAPSTMDGDLTIAALAAEAAWRHAIRRRNGAWGAARDYWRAQIKATRETLIAAEWALELSRIERAS